jgi:hypothetical protein
VSVHITRVDAVVTYVYVTMLNTCKIIVTLQRYITNASQLEAYQQHEEAALYKALIGRKDYIDWYSQCSDYVCCHVSPHTKTNTMSQSTQNACHLQTIAIPMAYKCQGTSV